MNESNFSKKKNNHSSPKMDGVDIETESKINVCPFKLQWAIGMNVEVPVINLTTKKRNLIAYASSHMVILYDYETKEMTSLQGHKNFVSSLSSSRDGKWLFSADYEEDSVCIVWDTETRIPICSLFNPHGTNLIAATKLSPNGKYLVTVGNENPQIMKFWQWTRGSDEPDASIELKNTGEDRVKKISYNDDYPDQFVLTLSHSVIFISWRAGSLSLHQPKIQAKDEKNVGSLNDTCYVSKTHLAMSVTSNGFVLVWSDVVNNERFKTKKRTSNIKKLIKSVPLQRKNLTRIENEDEIIAIGNSLGQLYFYDYRLQLLYWCENYGLDAIVSIGFDRKSNLVRFHINEEKEDEENEEVSEEDDEELDEISNFGVDDEDSNEFLQDIIDEEVKEEIIADAPRKVTKKKKTERNAVKNLSIDGKKFMTSNESTDIDYLTIIEGIPVKPTDCKLEPTEFVPPKLIVSSTSGRIARLDISNLKCRYILHPAEGSVTALATRPKSEYAVTGNSLGTLCLYKFTTRSLMVTKKTPPLPNFVKILDDDEGNRDMTHVTCPQTHESLIGISALKFSPGSGEFLACGLQSGAIWLLHPDTLEPVDPIPYKHSSSTIRDLIFSDCGQFLAYSDEAFTVAVFKINNKSSKNLLNFLGKYHSHYMLVRQILFGKPVVGKNLPRLFSLGEDQNLVEYDLENSGPYPDPGLKISQIDRIEKTSVPLCMINYPQFGVESFFIIANSKHKFRLINDLTKTIRATFVGPIFGDPVEKMLIASQQMKRKNRKYMIFATSKEIGLIVLPFDGNPYKILAIIGHPKKILSIAISDCKKYLFTIGNNDRSILVWKINYRSVNTMVRLGGERLKPFYRLIDGDKEGWLVNEIKDLFYYAQILHQGENTTSKRIVTDKVSIMQLPNLMRAIGFYPSNEELEIMMEEVSYKNYADTGELVDEISFEEFVKLYINHRPAFGVTRNEIKESFKIFARPENLDNPCLSSKEFLQVLFGCGNGKIELPNEKFYGEPLSAEEAHAYLRRLLPQDEDSTSYTGSRDDKDSKSELNFQFLPPTISYKDFTEEILGISQVSKTA